MLSRVPLRRLPRLVSTSSRRLLSSAATPAPTNPSCSAAAAAARTAAGPAPSAGARARARTDSAWTSVKGALVLALGVGACGGIYFADELALAAGSDDEYRRRRREAEARRRGISGVDGGGGDSDRGYAGSGAGGSSFLKGIGALAGVCALSVFAFALTRYKRCSPNEVLVVFGHTGQDTAKLVHGGGTVVWPIIQDYGVLSLEPFPLEIPLRNALSLEKVRVSVPSVFTLAVGTHESIMKSAAQRLLDMDHEAIEHQALEIITGQLRQVVASMTIEQINRDREKFEETVRHHAGKELEKIGLVVR